MKITGSSKLSYTPQYLTVDGQPWFPVMGEMHYSRVGRERWKDELAMMKAGGVDIVSCYCIWLHHEEEEGQFDFTGERDLHAFLELVQESGMLCWLRIGPWAHGEVRHGGLPDWLMEKEAAGELHTRTDDPAYLAYVKKWYTAVYEQVKDFLREDGEAADGTRTRRDRNGLSDNADLDRNDNSRRHVSGNRRFVTEEDNFCEVNGRRSRSGIVLGIQIENEYGHAGGQGGIRGEQHMRTLRHMAEEIGFHAPYWSATGWGGAVTGGMLPVMGGYCEAPWDQRTTELEPSVNYVFTKERNDHGIASDHGIGADVTFSYRDFPYLTAELGGGLQVTGHRRPIATGDDTAAMSMVKLGSGCNLLGWYMYAGGTNPQGRLTTLEENRATGSPNDLPIRSYDFHAPLRESGLRSDAYRRLRLLAMFVHDFNDEIATAEYIPQPGNPEKPEDLTSLRTAVRVNPATGTGFFFVNNYERRCTMASHENAHLQAFGPEENSRSQSVTKMQQSQHITSAVDQAAQRDGQVPAGRRVLADFGRRTVRDGDYFFYPFHLPLTNRAAMGTSAASTAGNGETVSGMGPSKEAVENTAAEIRRDTGSALLAHALATPLCILKTPADPAAGTGPETTYVFYVDGNRAEADPSLLANPASIYTMEGQVPQGVRILTLPEKDALHSYKYTKDGRDYLLISDDDFLEKDGHLYLDSLVETKGRAFFRSYPALPFLPDGFAPSADGPFTLYESHSILHNTAYCQSAVKLPVRLSTGKDLQISVRVRGMDPAAIETYLTIDYVGNTAELRRTDPAHPDTPLPEDPARHDLLDDSFYTGEPWTIAMQDIAARFADPTAEDTISPGEQETQDYRNAKGINDEGADEDNGTKRHAASATRSIYETSFTPALNAELVIKPLQENTKVYLQEWPTMTDGCACGLNDLSVKALYRTRIY